MAVQSCNICKVVDSQTSRNLLYSELLNGYIHVYCLEQALVKNAFNEVYTKIAKEVGLL